MTQLGIDVSEHNGPIDWQAIAAAGIGFAIIRLGYGNGHLDSLFYAHVNGALAAGLSVGTYFYSYALHEEAAEREADFMISVLKDCGLAVEKLPMGCWLDMEDADGYKVNHGIRDGGIITSLCCRFLETVKVNGYPAGLYASYDWLTRVIGTDSLPPETPYWCAQWGRKCDFPKASLWQYTNHLAIGKQLFDGDRMLISNGKENGSA